MLIENEDIYIDILCISETWLQPNIQDDLISIKNYNVFRNDNPLNSRGSVTCIYVKNIFTCKKYENIELTDAASSKGIEDMWVSTQASKIKSSIVGAVYQHPNTNLTALHIWIVSKNALHSNCTA